MYSKRIVRREVPDQIPGLPAALHPRLHRIYAARQVQSAVGLDYSLSLLHPYLHLSGIDVAVDLLEAALTEQQRIMVVGDFDADGATSCALVVRTLRRMGAGEVDYLVPNRFEYSYGLTPEIVQLAARKRPDIIITVDNGITSFAGVESARGLGIKVLVTDHHLPAETLPAADAIVNPNCTGDEFPSKNLAGVGVAFYLLAALRARLREKGWFEGEGISVPNLADMLDLVALGTVADVVPLDHNNRILVAQGLARIHQGRCCAGIMALTRISGRDYRRLTSGDLGYAIGPRLNAAGRLQDMSQGIECLLCDDETRAMEMAQELDELNRERRTVEVGMQAQALELLKGVDLADGDVMPVGLCLYDESWHEGVIGILASRIRERYHRPVIGFAPAASGVGQLKGSARSIPGLHIRDILDNLSKHNPGLIIRFGGHAMAAGLALEMANLAAFKQAFDQEVRKHLREADLEGILLSDGPLESDDFSLDFAETLRDAGPWGQMFPEPVFDGEFALLQRRIVGERHLKLVVYAPGTNRRTDVIAFNQRDDDWPKDVSLVKLAYRLDVNEFRGRRKVQLVAEYVEPVTQVGRTDPLPP